MCGIAGWISYDRDFTAHQDIIAAMMKTMARRGPDAGGVWIESNAASDPVFVSACRHTRTAEIEAGRRIPLDLVEAL